MKSPSANSDLIDRAKRVAPRRDAWWRGALAMGALMLVILGVAACGGGLSKSPASSAATTTSAGSSNSSGGSGDFLQHAVQYAQCMRSNGVTNFPDPNANGGAQPINPAGVDTNSPNYEAAAQACRKYLPTVGVNPTQQGQGQQLQFAQCMRKHGITNFPDPNDAAGQQSLSQYGIDTNSSAFQAANQACSSLLPLESSSP